MQLFHTVSFTPIVALVMSCNYFCEWKMHAFSTKKSLW